MNEPASSKLATYNTEDLFSSLSGEGYSAQLRGFNAIDRYLNLPSLPYTWIETDANIAVLAKFIENLRFPGMDIADGAADIPGGTCYFSCLENGEQIKPSSPLLSFAYNCERRRFLDPLNIYPLVRKLKDGADLSWEEAGFIQNAAGIDRYRTIMDISLFAARYNMEPFTPGQIDIFSEAMETPSGIPSGNYHPAPPPSPETQRTFLCCLLISPWPEKGFEILKQTGFLEEFWPILSSLNEVDHSKEFHPEGNVWNHTMETFQHRKALGSGAFDLRLSLGLLLHDAGKPIAASNGGRRFDGHAELGAKTAARFLERLEFEPTLVQDIYYLVKNHMLPAALKRLPLAKTSKIMASPLFPTLMELYRCDESSSFKGLDNYYENSAAYQSYLKKLKNPYINIRQTWSG